MPYFDNNSTTPLDPVAREVLVDALANSWANPSSPYRSSAIVRASIQKCREMIGTRIGVSPDLITFTSGATEANNSVFCHLARNSSSTSRVLLSPFEHPSVAEAAHFWFSNRVDFLKAQPNGMISIEELEKYLEEQKLTVLVSVLAASNESGVIQPWSEVARLCNSFKVKYHCDSTQLPGKEALENLNQCSFSVSSAHKFGGPKGIGWLVGENTSSLILGGEQEKGRRGGTENYPSILAACSAWKSNVETSINISELSKYRDDFEERMNEIFPEIRFIGRNSPRLWNTSLFILPRFENLALVGKLDKLGFQVSTGSACSTFKDGGSAIAKAMGFSSSEMKCLIRVSSFQSHTRFDWNGLTSAFEQAIKELEEDSSHSPVISI